MFGFRLRLGLLTLLMLDLPGHAAEFVPIQPYRELGDSLFAEFGFGETLRVETFEDGELNLPGVTQTIGSTTRAFITEGHSVAEDVGPNGQGLALQASPVSCTATFPRQCPAAVSFAFAEQASLPTYVGFVWTHAFRADDKARSPWARVSILDATGESRMTLINQLPTRAELHDPHVDDRLISFINDVGIRQMDITIVTDGMGLGGHFAIDHLQYGDAAMAGDTDVDGDVDFGDFLRLSKSFGKAARWRSGDFDFNGKTEFADFLKLAHNFGKNSSRELDGTRVTSVPEPSASLALIGMLLTFGWLPKVRIASQ